MVLKKKSVTMKVDFDFFEKTFEPARRRMEAKIGSRVGQVDFTKMIHKSKMSLNIKLNLFPKKNARKNKNKK